MQNAFFNAEKYTWVLVKSRKNLTFYLCCILLIFFNITKCANYFNVFVYLILLPLQIVFSEWIKQWTKGAAYIQWALTARWHSPHLLLWHWELFSTSCPDFWHKKNRWEWTISNLSPRSRFGLVKVISSHISNNSDTLLVWIFLLQTSFQCGICNYPCFHDICIRCLSTCYNILMFLFSVNYCIIQSNPP